MISQYCPAKLNLFLRIVGQRSDHHHNLESIFFKINLFDEISVSKSSHFSVKIVGEFANLIDIDNNIFTQIFNFFSRQFKLQSAVEIKLYKNIPIGAGLGGGSSNGASFIKILNQIFELNLSSLAMHDIALKFGSDIAFFLHDSPSLVSGRGEVVEPLSNISLAFTENFVKALSSCKILLINPKITLPTPQIFKNYAQKIANNKLRYSSLINRHELFKMSLANILQNFNNDLENSAFDFAPELLKIKFDLEKFLPLSAKMSGSGSSFFAIFDNEANYEKCIDFFNRNYPQYLIQQVAPIN